jgi:hypothetical protein
MYDSPTLIKHHLVFEKKEVLVVPKHMWSCYLSVSMLTLVCILLYIYYIFNM